MSRDRNRDTRIVGRLCETALQGNGICPRCLTIRKAVSTLAERQRVNAMAILFRAPFPDFSKPFLILANDHVDFRRDLQNLVARDCKHAVVF